MQCKLLDAQWLGVPQMRQRVIFIGVRNDLQKQPVFPMPLSYRYSVREALPWIMTAEFGPTIRTAHTLDISRYAIGKKWDELKPGEGVYYGGRLCKPDLNAPCPTVTSTGGTVGAASVTHPIERRKFTIAELKRICAFPDDFILTGSYAQQWERLGNAVPPVMMYHIACTIRDHILT